ncbi:helix-turn-helix domain-containing protein [Streptomyces sp. NPDC057798]|uniref:helix-turn-helix domain-containing protein n=1 Tax=Streptomyces sp. NPDC057798 TaxID=3346252 RepID=UPI0036ACE7F5
MGTPLGDFVRAKRDSIDPASLGLPERGRRRSPGLRRLDLAARAGISVEYLTRIEQGRDRNPSIAVVNALADALSLDPAERNHLRYLAKITGGECSAHSRPAPPRREVRATVLETLRLLEPGIAVVTNRLGDLLARTSGYEAVTRGTGLLDSDAPNLTRYLFTDPRARAFFADWDAVADEQVFDLWLAPSVENSEWFTSELAPVAGPDFTRRLNRHTVPRRGELRLNHPSGLELRLRREILELSEDGQQLVVFLPADEATAGVVEGLLRPPGGGRLRAIS